MSKKRIHRVTVYLLDNRRKRVLLQRCSQGPFAGKYIALSDLINDDETPVETAQRLVSEKTHLEFEFMGHQPSMPMVLDEISAKIYPPLHVHVIVADDHTDYVDYVYLARAFVAPEFREDSDLEWVNQSTVKNAPNHVKHLVHYILALVNT